MKRKAWTTQEQQDITKLTPERVRQLKQLCHPDRHNGSKLATSIFCWLDEVSQELDKRAKRV